MGQPKAACQLIIYGGEVAKNLVGVVKEVADVGYAGVECGNLSAQIDAPSLKRLFEDNGLGCAGIHTGFDDLVNRTYEHIDYAKGAGSNYLIVSGVGDQSKGIVAYQQAAEKFNEIGDKCVNAGLKFCYHNHSWEFAKFDGVTALLRLYDLTCTERVSLCVDTYWVHHGGESPAEFIRTYLDRIALVHFKDMKDETFAEVGQGVLDFPGIMEALSAADLEWITVEQDRTDKTPKESVTLSRQYMRDKLAI